MTSTSTEQYGKEIENNFLRFDSLSWEISLSLNLISSAFANWRKQREKKNVYISTEASASLVLLRIPHSF